jgi:hypothetical protein
VLGLHIIEDWQERDIGGGRRRENERKERKEDKREKISSGGIGQQKIAHPPFYQVLALRILEEWQEREE